MKWLLYGVLLALAGSNTAQAYLPAREDLLAHCVNRRTTPDTVAAPYALQTAEGRQEIEIVVAPDAWAWNYDPFSESPTYEWHDGKRRDDNADVRIKIPAPVRFDTLFAQNKCENLLAALERAGIDLRRATTLVHASERRSAVLYGTADGNWVAFDRVSYRPVAAQWIVRDSDTLPEGAEAGSWWRVLYEMRYRDIRNLPDTVVITRELYAPGDGQPLSGIGQTGFVALPVLTPLTPLDRSQLTLKRLDQPTRVSDPRKGSSRPRGRG